VVSATDAGAPSSPDLYPTSPLEYERAVGHLYVQCCVYAKPVILSTDLRVLCPALHRERLTRFAFPLDGLPSLCEYAPDSPSERNRYQKDSA